MKRSKCEASKYYLNGLEGYYIITGGTDFLNLHGKCPF